VRNIRHKGVDEIKALKTGGDVNEDGVKKGGEYIQKLTDKFIKQIDELVSGKEKEIMEV
jgi:ribosome recycling factor